VFDPSFIGLQVPGFAQACYGDSDDPASLPLDVCFFFFHPCSIMFLDNAGAGRQRPSVSGASPDSRKMFLGLAFVASGDFYLRRSR